MSDLSELYQEVILDHNRNPRNFGRMENADRAIEGFNPLCGDRFTLYVKMNGDVVEDIRFEGKGCAISKASASVMTEQMKGLTKSEAHQALEQFQHLVVHDNGEEPDIMKIGEMAALAGVRQYPVRVKCATLAWHTAWSAINGQAEPVSTE